MARWDKLLSLPVQSPPKFEISAADLEWSKVEGWADNIEKVAFIPFDRVDDFLNGESANKEFPTRFYVEARRRGNPSKEKVDGILEFTMYRCAFGPDDRREGGSIRPSRNTYVPKKKPAGRPSIKRGCQCYFFVKRLVAKPSAALIIYKQDKHVDENGLPCHGPQDIKSAGTRAMFSPYIAEDLRLLVSSLLHVGCSVETIMHMRNESIEKQTGPFNPDDLLNHRYVRRLERSIRRSNYHLDEDDAISIEMWADKHENDIFFREDYSDSGPSILGIQTEWQLQQLIRFSNNSIMASDSRFGTNKLKLPVHSLLVFDSDKKAIPVAWILSPQCANVDAYKWIRALQRRVHNKDPTWKLAGFIVDDPSADVTTIREVFRCSVLISFWRVRHAWHKNLVKKCLNIEMRSEMAKRLGQAIYNICKGSGDIHMFTDFMEDFIDCPDFVDYFRASWFPRIGMWIVALKSLPFASQETCASIEGYHHSLKGQLLCEKKESLYRRSDWLVDKLYKNVHSHFFIDQYPGKEEFARYMKGKTVISLTSWRRASDIPDSDVALEDKYAKVISQRVREKAYVVWNPGSEFSLCDCDWSGLGNLCKHMIKVTSVCRRKVDMPSISLFKYKQTLMSMLHCPPYDSLIRDHAVSLAASVQIQLSTLLDIERTAKQHGSDDAIGDADAIVIEDTHDILKNASELGNGLPDGVASVDLVGEKVMDKRASENGIVGGEVAGHMSAQDDMDVDPISLCASPSRFMPSDDILFSNGNEERQLFHTTFDSTESYSLNNDDFIISNRVQDEEKDFCDAMISKRACGDDLDGALTGNMMDVDPKSIQLPMFQCEIH